MCQTIDLFDDYEGAADRSSDSSPFIAEYEGSEYEGVVCLHLQTFDVQSAMYVHAPNELVLGYTRTMMNFLLFNKRPRRIGMIGLGGGSMQKSCYRGLPNAIISVAEIDPRVIALRDRFFIPKDDDRFVVSCEDGAEFVRRQPGHFDVLLVDGFDNEGQPPQLCSSQFYSDCYQSLTSRGILVVNICDGQHLISRIRRRFRNQVIVTDSDANSANTIVFAGKGNILAQAQWPPRPEKVAQHWRKGSDEIRETAGTCTDLRL
jgi:spermidine synthase